MLETHRRPADFVTEDSSMKLDKQHEIEAITGLSSLPLVSAMMGIMELQGDICALHLPQPTVIRRAGLELIEINYEDFDSQSRSDCRSEDMCPINKSKQIICEALHEPVFQNPPILHDCHLVGGCMRDWKQHQPNGVATSMAHRFHHLARLVQGQWASQANGNY